jgi:hypothetical protein
MKTRLIFSLIAALPFSVCHSKTCSPKQRVQMFELLQYDKDIDVISEVHKKCALYGSVSGGNSSTSTPKLAGNKAVVASGIPDGQRGGDDPSEEVKVATRRAEQAAVTAADAASKELQSKSEDAAALKAVAKISAAAAKSAPTNDAVVTEAKVDAAQAASAKVAEAGAKTAASQAQKTAVAATEAASLANATPAKNGNSASDFFSKDWSVGIAWLHNNKDVISDATIQNKIVRANSSQRSQPAFLVARNFYFDHEDGSCLWTSIESCPGLFLAAGITGSGQSSIIDFLGGGLLLGFGGGKKTSDQQHHIGIGIGRRFGVRLLGDGFSANTPPPDGESQVRYKSTDITAPFIFYTYNFGK